MEHWWMGQTSTEHHYDTKKYKVKWNEKLLIHICIFLAPAFLWSEKQEQINDEESKARIFK